MGWRFGAGPAAPRSADLARRRRGAHRQGRARHRGFVAGFAQPGAAGASGRDDRPDQRGPAHSRRRHRQRSAEYSRRICRLRRAVRMLEGLRLMRALWTGKPVDWQGRWTVTGGVLAPIPARPGGPPIWAAGSTPAALERIGRHFDGWFPNNPGAAFWGERWRQVLQAARDAGRDPAALVGAAYLTLAIDEDRARAEQRLDAFMERYYGQPAAVMRARQASFAGPAAAAVAWLREFAAAGASHLVLRFAGDAERHLETIARRRGEIG